MLTDASYRFDDRRGGESYRPADRPGRSPSRGYDSRRRSPPRNRSRPRADTWVPTDRGYGRPRSRSPVDYRRRSRTPPLQSRGYGPGPYGRRRSPPRRFSPRRDDRTRSPPPSWRSYSPHSETRSRDASKGRSSPKRTREGTPGSQVPRVVRRPSPVAPGNDRSSRATSPKPPLTNTFRSQSPFYDSRREQPADSSRGRPSSRTRQASPVHAMPSELSEPDRRSSPTSYAERRSQVPLRSHSRSPAPHASPRRHSRPLGRSPYHVSNHGQEPTLPEKDQEDSRRFLDIGSSERPQMGGGRFGGNIPTQPRNLGMGQSPPLGPSQGPKAGPPQNRASYNMSLLSAPTRPRRGPGPRDGPWTGSPMGRRGPIITASQSAPSGPRASFTPPTPLGGTYRQNNSRQNSTTSATSSPAPRGANHLAGLGAIIPGGRTLPSMLDYAVEKRLAQLDADREKLLDQVAETQRSKRAGLRDWDRLDRESSICALKSELAEGHLQRMADESMGGGVSF